MASMTRGSWRGWRAIGALGLVSALWVGCGGDTSTGGTGDGSCTTDAPCAEGKACTFAQGSCAQGTKGSCQSGFTCDGPPSGPLCTCDGKVVEGEYAECTQWEASEPFDDPGPCQQGTFKCGTVTCKRNAEVCEEQIPGVPGGMTSYQCVAFDKVKGTCAHGIPDCNCIDMTAVGGAGASCKADADHQETVTVALP